VAAARDRLIGVDLGAGSLKASVIDGTGRLLGEASEPIATRIPHPGWSEQDPADWYRAFCKAVPAALAAARTEPARLAGLGLSAGAHIPVLVDGTGQVLRPAILWNDQRSIEEARELREAAGELIVRTSLNRANPTWTLAMLKWLGRHEPEVARRTRRLFIAKDYLRHRITGDWHSDFSDAIGALMGDVATRNWSAELCRLIGWPIETLPPLLDPAAIAGKVGAEAARDAGLPEGLPVVTGSNDTTVELYGVGAIKAGQGAIKLATAAVVYLATDGPAVHPPVSCYPHIMPGMFYCATGTNSCASAHRWLRDEFFLPAVAAAGGDGSRAFAEMDRMAASAPPGSDGLLFHPYLQGERGPHWDPHLRASFIGLTMRHGRAHFVRALYEGIAFSVRDLLEAAQAEGLAFSGFRLIGGGARSALWRQIIADMLGVEIEQPENGDASFGAALVAGVGTGVFPSFEAAIERSVRIIGRAEPDARRHRFYSELFAIYREATRALQPLDHRLHALLEKDLPA
jgi:xylulokinase